MLLQGSAFTPGSIVSTFPICKEGHPQEQWVFNPNGTLTQVVSGLCLDTTQSVVMDALPLVINTCSGAPTQQVRASTPTPCIYIYLKRMEYAR